MVGAAGSNGTRIEAANNKDRNFTRSSLRVHSRGQQAVGGLFQAARRGRCRGRATSGGTCTKNLAEKIAALSEKRGRYQAILAQLEHRPGHPNFRLSNGSRRFDGKYRRETYFRTVQFSGEHKRLDLL
jgi:hypothetical protein